MKHLAIVLIVLLSVGVTSCTQKQENKKTATNAGEQTVTTGNQEEVEVDEDLIDEVFGNLLGDEVSEEEYVVDKSDMLDAKTILSESISGELSAEEKEGLLYMLEEEKLAYDVYVTLGEKWGAKIFTNISESEITHMEAVGDLLAKYNIEAPTQGQEIVGTFTLPAIQKLYDDLVAAGSVSLVEALKVGATIEDLDIYDIQEFLKTVTNEDIKAVYGNLLRGSRNHMRAFDKNIKNNGGDYTAQYISQEQYDEIIGGEQERGNGGGGNGNGGGNGKNR